MGQSPTPDFLDQQTQKRLDIFKWYPIEEKCAGCLRFTFFAQIFLPAAWILFPDHVTPRIS